MIRPEETASDLQMTDEQREAVRRQAELELAAALEEDRRTDAQPGDGEG